MKKKIIALMLMGAIMATSLSGCAKLNAIKDIIIGKTPVGDEVEDVIDDIEDEVEDEAEDEAEDKKEDEDDKKDGKLKGLTATKVGSVEVGGVYSSEGGVYFEDKYNKNRYGVMSKDGSKKSDAVYTYCRASSFSELFSVSESIIDTSNVANMNVFGVVDASGNEIVPQKYARVDFLNDRFVKVIEASGKTTNKEEALLYVNSNNAISTVPSNDATFFKGTWSVIDVETGKAVPGATGTLPYNVSAKGEFVTYIDGENHSHTLTESGKIFDGASPMENGAYVVDGVVYDTNGSTLWKFGPNDYKPSNYKNGYYIASRSGKYAVLDKSGKVLAEYPAYIKNVIGSLAHVDQAVYDFDGNIIINEVASVTFDPFTKCSSVLLKNGSDVLIDDKGNILLDCRTSGGKISMTTFTAESDNKYYSHKEGQFVIGGYSVTSARWIVEENNCIIDTFTGKSILENYSDYDISYSKYTNEYYIYATVSGTTDIYRITY